MSREPKAIALRPLDRAGYSVVDDPPDCFARRSLFPRDEPLAGAAEARSWAAGVERARELQRNRTLLTMLLVANVMLAIFVAWASTW